MEGSESKQRPKMLCIVALVAVVVAFLVLALKGEWVAATFGWLGVATVGGSLAWHLSEATREASKRLSIPLVRLVAVAALGVLLIEELALLRRFLLGSSGEKNLVRALIGSQVERWSVATTTLGISFVFALVILGTLAALGHVARDE